MEEEYTPEEKNEAVSQAEYMLSPDVPIQERNHYVNILMLFNKNMKLGNLQPSWIPAFLAWFDVVNALHKLGMYEEARAVIGRLSCWNSISGGINGFTMLCQSGSLQHSVIRDLSMRTEKEKKPKWHHKIAGAFSSKDSVEAERIRGEL